MGRDLPFESDFAPEFAALGPRSSILRDELAPGESVVWEGRPRAGRMIFRSLFVTCFGCVFFGFAALWTVMASSASSLFALFGLPFLIGGLGMILAPLWAAIWVARTRYAVTDRRVILIEPSGLGREVRNYPPAALGNIVRTQRWDGSGDLIFEEIQTSDRDGDRRTTRRGFLAISDVRRVEALIRSTLLDESA